MGRHVWGPIQGPASLLLPPAAATAAAGPGEEQERPTRKRKSRWSDAEPAAAKAEAVGDSMALAIFPERVVLSSGVEIVLPPTLTGRAPGGDPEVIEIHRAVSACRLPPPPPAAAAACRRPRRLHHNCPLHICPSLQLNEVNRKLLSGVVDLPPESERSPSPPPVYDQFGMRCGLPCACIQAGGALAIRPDREVHCRERERGETPTS